ncbi:MAG: hypothetical protein U1E83_08745 [Methylotetracoccus sp.]
MNRTLSTLSAALLSGGLLAVGPVQGALIFEDVAPTPNGRLQIIVGFANDIPYVGEPATLQMSPYLFPKGEPDNWNDARFVSMSDNQPGNPNTYPHDKVDITATVELLDDQGNVIKRGKLPDKFDQVDHGTYESSFVPGTAGTYAFVLNGTVNQFTIRDMRFVCKPLDQLHARLGDGIPCVIDRVKPIPFAPEAPSN